MIPSFVEMLLVDAREGSSNDHQIFKGRSPLTTEQTVVTDSSRLNCSSPNPKGAIDGKTLMEMFHIKTHIELFKTGFDEKQIAKFSRKNQKTYYSFIYR